MKSKIFNYTHFLSASILQDTPSMGQVLMTRHLSTFVFAFMMYDCMQSKPMYVVV